MSKKIIYLLSLLMALSLVFASCKKNAAGTGVGDDWIAEPPKDEDNTAGQVGDNGLANVDNSDDLVSDKPLITDVVFQGNGVDYLRNPVVVVMGADKSKVAVFAEKRYKSKGAINDVGINGKDAVDIMVRVSGNAGKRFEEEQVVGKTASSAADSHGAAVVYKVSDTEVIVVASAGGGIARTAQYAQKGQETTEKPASRIEYIHGTLNDKTFQWGTWTEVKLTKEGDLLTKVQAIMTPNGKDYYTQMGTHSAKGQAIISGGKATLILPVVMAQQGNETDVKEMMGVYFLQGAFTSGNPTVTWTEIGDGSENNTYVRFAQNGTQNTSHFKEARIVAASSATSFEYVVVPGYGKSVYALGSGVKQPADSSITGHFGSPGYLTFLWHGSTNYAPKSYKNENPNQSLFMAAQAAAPNGNVTLYKVEKDSLTRNGKGHIFNKVSKSASIDILGDGTVVSVAEEGANGEMNFYSVFKRYSQKYLASLLDN